MRGIRSVREEVGQLGSHSRKSSVIRSCAPFHVESLSVFMPVTVVRNTERKRECVVGARLDSYGFVVCRVT